VREHRYHSSLHTSSSLSTSFKPADLAASLETAAASPGLAAGGGAGAGAAGARAGAADAGAGAGAGASAAGAGAAGAAAAGSGSPAIPRASVAGLAAAGFTGVGGTSFDPPHPIGRQGSPRWSVPWWDRADRLLQRCTTTEPALPPPIARSEDRAQASWSTG
jgi:hypothetical protein